MVYVTRKERFSAAHRLYKPGYNDEQNYETFGKCAHPNWHGHNYILYVTVRGKVDPDTRFLITIHELSDIIKERIIEKVDHKNLNLDVDFLDGIQPTCENLSMAIWKELKPYINNLNNELYCVRLEETENNFFEYYGE